MSELEEYKTEAVKKLCDKYEWLRERTKSLFELLGECKNTEEVDLVTELLERFKMIEEPERYLGYTGMAEYIASNFVVDKTLIVAMTKGHDPDSGQKVLQDLKTFLIEKDIRTKNFQNYFGFSPKINNTYEKIIVVDEFLGSGKTVRNRVKDMKTLDNIEEIHFCLLAGVESSIRKLEMELPERVKIYCHYQIKKGIWDFNTIIERFRKTRLMIDMEGRLSQKIGTRDLACYRFGYGNAQSLMSFGRYNIPNSVFPIFWWPNHDFKRHTIFNRDEDGFV